jgi:hypothetical protein
MTLSKFLVVANFVVSLAIAGWAMGFYFTRVDYTTNHPSSPGQFSTYVAKLRTDRGDSGSPTPQDTEEAYKDPQVGRMVGRDAHLKEMVTQMRPAEASWREARSLVRDREAFRDEDRKFYQAEIMKVYEPQQPVQLQEVVLGKDGLPDLKPDPKNKAHQVVQMRPVNDRFGKPLHPLAYYAKLHEDNLLALAKLSKEFDGLLQKDFDLTVELEGTTFVKGLRKRIEDERLKGIDILSEYEIVRPLLFKTVGDAEFLLARKRQLEKRIKALEESPVSKP